LGATHQLILFSNSLSGPDAEALLARLDIEDLFHEVRFEAGKPIGMKERIRLLTEETGVSPESIVSIGDHPWNDLYPAREAGAHTVLVSPYADLDRPEWSHRVPGVEELLTLLSDEWVMGAA
jgi:FMN phosphatase YigB (HAD superfamily)